MFKYELKNRKAEEEYLVSVIVPVYMVEKYLETCINSLINQSFNSYEIILVDDDMGY